MTWRSSTTCSARERLTFDLTTAAAGNDPAVELTVKPEQAIAPGTGGNIHLDANESPSPQSGEIPNRTGFVWRLLCKTAVSYTIAYGGTYSDRTADKGNVHVNTLEMTWHEILTATVSSGGTLTTSPVQLTLNGTTTNENNVNGENRTGKCVLASGKTPIEAGGFIDLTPSAAPANGSLLTGYRMFNVWASMPLDVANGEAGYGPGSESGCQRDDLRPFLAVTASTALPPSWEAAALARTTGSWGTPIRLDRNASFTATSPDGNATDTVQVKATLSVTTTGTLK